MVLAHGKYQSPLGMDSNVAESKGARRRDRLGLIIASNGVQAPVAELGVDHSAARDVVFAAAILVHSVAHVGRCRGDLDRLTAGNEPPPQTGPASLVGVGTPASRCAPHRSARPRVRLKRWSTGRPRSETPMIRTGQSSQAQCRGRDAKRRASRLPHLLVQLWRMVQDREHNQVRLA